MVWTETIPSGGALRELKRTELVKAAARYFTRFGYHRTTLADVAKGLGLTKSAIYHYFPDKQALLGECSRWGHESILAIPSAENSDPVKRLRDLCVRYAEVVAENGLGFVVFCDLAELSPSDRASVLRLRRGIDSRFRELIEDAVRQGALTARDSKLRSLMLLGALNWMSRWHDPEGPLKSGEIAGFFFDDWLAGASSAPENTKPRTNRRTKICESSSRAPRMEA